MLKHKFVILSSKEPLAIASIFSLKVLNTLSVIWYWMRSYMLNNIGLDNIGTIVAYKTWSVISD